MISRKNISLRDILFSASSFKIRLLKIVDYFFGFIIKFVCRTSNVATAAINNDKVGRILIIRPGGIGDAVLLIPFLVNLKKIFSRASVDILAEKRNVDVFSLAKSFISEVFCYDVLNVGIYLKLKNKDYDIIFDTEQWHNLSAALAYFLGRKERVGFATNPRRFNCYTRLVNYSQSDYEVESFLNLLKAVAEGVSFCPVAPPFGFLSDELRLWAQKAITSDSGRVVAVSLGASIVERMWGARNFQDLANFLISRGYKVLFLGGIRERKIYSKIEGGIRQKDKIINFVGRSSLAQSAALLTRCIFYIGLDSGVLHLAYALGLPTISLFGPGISDKWAPTGLAHITITKKLSCSPCTLFGYTMRCPDPRCVREIGVQDVIFEIERMEKLIGEQAKS